MGGAATSGGVTSDEAMFVSGSSIGALTVISIGAAVVVWLVRVIFF